MVRRANPGGLMPVNRRPRADRPFDLDQPSIEIPGLQYGAQVHSAAREKKE